ncbi:hypothetical protein D3C71_1466590 [compost metagenome]
MVESTWDWACAVAIPVMTLANSAMCARDRFTGWPPGSELSECVHSRIDQILECASPPPTKPPGATAGGPLSREAVGPTFPHPCSSTSGKRFRKPPCAFSILRLHGCIAHVSKEAYSCFNACCSRSHWSAPPSWSTLTCQPPIPLRSTGRSQGFSNACSTATRTPRSGTVSSPSFAQHWNGSLCK